MRIYFSWRKTIIGTTLIVVCLLMSRWQWNRYLEKEAYIEELHARLRMPVESIDSVLSGRIPTWESLIHRRFTVSGEYDFSKEFLLQNRKYNDEPGFYLITPLKLQPSGSYVLVNRGFIPYDQRSPEARLQFRKAATVTFTALVKASMQGWHLFGIPLGPHDPIPSLDAPWIDTWLRVEIPKIQRQLPYDVLPVYLEILDGFDPLTDAHRFLTAKSGKDDMLSLATREVKIAGSLPTAPEAYPIPVFDTIVPAGRHYGYVFQWLFIALLIGLSTVILQLRPPRAHH